MDTKIYTLLDEIHAAKVLRLQKKLDAISEMIHELDEEIVAWQALEESRICQALEEVKAQEEQLYESIWAELDASKAGGDPDADDGGTGCTGPKYKYRHNLPLH